MTVPDSNSTADRFEIHFQSVFAQGRALVFPCDARGNVDMDRLSEESRCDYLFARMMVRREWVPPMVVKVVPPRAGAAAVASRQSDDLLVFT